MQDLILEMQQTLATAIARGDSAACDDAKVVLVDLKRLAIKVQEVETQVATLNAVIGVVNDGLG